jgi:hypothetical protein
MPDSASLVSGINPDLQIAGKDKIFPGHILGGRHMANPV